MSRRPCKLRVVALGNGTVEIHWSDGSISIARDEVKHARILRAFQKPGRPYVHVRPRDDSK